MVAEFSHSASHLFGAVLPSLMTGRHTTCSRSVSTVPQPVGRPPKCKKKSGKTGVTSTEIPSPPPPPRLRLTPTFCSPVLSMVEEHPPREANTDVAENVLLTLCSPAPWCKGGKETQRNSEVPEVGSSSATGSSLPSRHLQDGKYSVLSMRQTVRVGAQTMKASNFSFCSLVQYPITVHSEDEPWAIPFLIPLHDGMSEMLPLQSDTCWEAARFSITEVMDVSSKSLNIGYKFSTHTAHDPHCALSTPTHWLDLIHKASIENEHLNSKGKNRKRLYM